jgi:hypothetical protein
MAKDGTYRGGRRIRAGDKPEPLADKITKGKTAKVLEVPDLHPEILEAQDLEVDDDLVGEDIPSLANTYAQNKKTGSH